MPVQSDRLISIDIHLVNITVDRLCSMTRRFLRLENAVPYVHPLLRSQPNWTLDDGKYRSPTAENSSVENLLDSTILESTFFPK